MKFLISEPADEYHAKSKLYLSSHRLADFRRAPILFYRKELGIIEDVDRPAYALGRATHTMILEGEDAFNDQYAVGGPINEKTGKVYGSTTKKYFEWAADQGKPVITNENAKLVRAMNKSVHNHEHAHGLLSNGVAEGVVRAEYCGIQCQIRMDWYNPEDGFIDLKTCMDVDFFENDARRYGYAYQLAFYRAVLDQEIGAIAPVWLIAVEKKEPFRCGVWRVGTEVLGQAQIENEAAIERLKVCRGTNEWPSGYEDIREFDYL